MKKNRVPLSRKGLVTVLTVSGIGILLISTAYFRSPQVSVSATPDPQVRVETDLPATKTTSALINETAAHVMNAAAQQAESYPNVTPKQLQTLFSPTLEGTDIDGEIRVGDDGKVVLNLEIKDFFDYFLSAVGEVSPELALSELLKVISQSLPPENALEAKQLLDNYLAYKEQAVNLMSQPMLPRDQQTREYQLQTMEDTLAQLRLLRRENMPGEQVEAFFGLEEAYEDYTIATVRVQFDQTMSDEDKAALIQYHRSQLPDQIRQTENQVVSDNQKNIAIQEALLSDDEAGLISQLDSHGYSDSQKQEILAFKREQQAFDQRYKQYQAAKQLRLAELAGEEERKEAIATLQSQYFYSEQELTQAKVRDLRS